MYLDPESGNESGKVGVEEGGKSYGDKEGEFVGIGNVVCGNEDECRRIKVADGSEICLRHGAEGWRWEGGAWVLAVN